MNAPAVFNLCEAAVWAAAAAVLFRRSAREPEPMRKLGRRTAAVLAVFSLTDLIEIRTGAWWDPWWLFALKLTCVLSLAAAGMAYRRLRNRHD